MITVEGIVLKERPVGEQDKFIDILTVENGVIEISVKGARKINGKSGSSTQLFAYSRFCIQQRRDRLYLNSAEPIHIFYDLRNSLSGISLASYFADVLRTSIGQQTQSSDILRLFLNTLHFLETGKRNEIMLKTIFELRLMSEIGFMPNIVSCRKCGAFEADFIIFRLSDGSFCCKDCFEGESKDGFYCITRSVLDAIRHIVLVDFDRLFNFRLSDRALEMLSEVSEAYTLSKLERSFATLEFYKSLDNLGK